MPRLRKSFFVSFAAICAVCAAPAGASAATYYVNEDRPDDSGDCQFVFTACKTIAGAVTKAGDNDTILIDGGDYSDSAVVPDAGQTLSGQDFDGDTDMPAVVDAGAGAPLSLTNAGNTIQGLTLRGNTRSIGVAATAEIRDNTFDDPDQPTEGEIVIANASASGTEISGNTFTDPNNVFFTMGTQGDTAIYQNSVDADLSITGNSFHGFQASIHLDSSNANFLIADNVITGIHGLGGTGIGVYQADLVATIVHNTISDPAETSTTGTHGINTFGNPGDDTRVELRRNLITEMPVGVRIDDGPGVSFNSDMIVGNLSYGVDAKDSSPHAGTEADLNMTNVTLWDNSIDLNMANNDLVFDSGIIQDPIVLAGTTQCEITNSRGPTTTGTNCETFQTSADPGFLAGGGYRLAAGSPMIDAGSPASPVAPNNLDRDGDARALDGTPSCPIVPIRDIGADEFVAGTASCPVGSTPVTTGPAPQLAPPPKKKKCKRKKKSAGAAAKCKKKK